jgi:hypothetical protein
VQSDRGKGNHRLPESTGMTENQFVIISVIPEIYDRRFLSTKGLLSLASQSQFLYSNNLCSTIASAAKFRFIAGEDTP